jgi:hypothetical protein
MILNSRTCSHILISLGLLCAVSCKPPTLAGSWKSREVSRSKSPTEKVEAVVVSADGGATTSVVTSIYLTRAGKRVKADSDLVFASDHDKELTLKWRDSTTLEIHYSEARILQFRNSWEGIEIRLLPSNQEYSLPMSVRSTFR